MTLREALADYLRLRRRLGFEMPQDGRLLEGFVEFLEQAGARRITTDLALMWARMPVDAHPHRWRQRLSVVRGFARYLATIDSASEVPSKDLLPGHRPRIAPYIYTEKEIQALMAAAGRLRPSLRAARHQTLIGLLAVTGMRPGEALALDRQDVDLRHGVVHVRAGKQKKQREVPLHASTVRALRNYARLRDARFPEPTTPAFFIGAGVGGCLVGSSTGPSRSSSARSDWTAAALAPDHVRTISAMPWLFARSWIGIGLARTPTGGCRCCPRSSGMWTRPVRTGIWRRSPSCSS